MVSVLDERAGPARPGAIPREAIERVLGAPACHGKANHRGASPGQLATHYAPDTPLRLAGDQRQRPTRRCSPSAVTCPRVRRSPSISAPSGNLEEAAARLFAALRELDQAGAAAIAVMPIPDHGLGEAINDRSACGLQRAANDALALSHDARTKP